VLYQVLDNKKECYAIFCKDALYHYPSSEELTHTWEYTPHFADPKIEYAKIWTNGRSLSQVCPEHLKEEWTKVCAQATAFIKSFNEAKINFDDVCFYDSVPKKFLIRYCRLKNDICEWVFEHHKKPKNYNFLLNLIKFTDKIKSQTLSTRTKNLDFINSKVRKSFNKIKSSQSTINYNAFGTATGRLTTEKDSFPILTLNKELRSVLVPKNDLFLEFDYNAAELRTLFGLLGKDQPQGDIHAWIKENIFSEKLTREEVKKKVFAWLYNPKAKNKKLNDFLPRNQVINKFYVDGTVHTPFGRQIEAPEDKALNYLIQSSTSDLFLTNLLKIDAMLQDRKSYISFCVHDSFVIDFDNRDRDLVEKIMKVFSNTSMGEFKVSLHAGKTYGDMRRVM